MNRLTYFLLPLLGLALVAAGYFAWRLQSYTPALPANYLASEKDYGVTIDLTQYENLVEPLAEMQGSGLVWLRQPVAWAEIEPAPGRFQWQALDRVMAAVATSNEDQLLRMDRHINRTEDEAAILAFPVI